MAVKKYFDRHLRFLEKVYKGRHIEETTKLFNARFGMNAKPGGIKTFAQRHGLKSGYKPGNNKKYPEEQINFLKKIVPGRSHIEITRLFNERFELNVSVDKMKGIIANHKLNTGRTGHFPKGHVPKNKGRKGYCPPGCEKGWFTKGQKPVNTLPIGSTRYGKDGYMQIKYSEKTGTSPSNRWKGVHVMLWEKSNGPVPKGHVVIFLDQNKNNITIENLMMISRRIHRTMCHMNWYSVDRDITKTNILRASIKSKVIDRKKNTFKEIKSEKMAFIDNNGNRIVVAQVSNKSLYVPARKTKRGLCRLRAQIKTRRSLDEARRDLFEYAQFRGWQRI